MKNQIPNPKQLAIAGVFTLALFVWLNTLDLSWMPVFRTISECLPEDTFVAIFNKFIWSVGFVGACLLVYITPSHEVILQKKFILFTLVNLFVGFALLLLGPAIEDADGLAAVASMIFCGSVPGALLMLVFTGTASFSGILLFLYACKSFYVFKLARK